MRRSTVPTTAPDDEAPGRVAELLAREERVPASVAARLLGVSRKHVIALGRDDLLDLADLRLPGEPRATWSVSLASIRELVQARSALRWPSAPVRPPKPS
jgi:hypothetical protein